MKKFIRPFRFNPVKEIDLTYDRFKIIVEGTERLRAIFVDLFYMIKNHDSKKQHNYIQKFYQQLDATWNNWKEFKKYILSDELITYFSERYICEKTYDILFETLTNEQLKNDMKMMRFLQVLKEEDKLHHLLPHSIHLDDDLAIADQIEHCLVVLRHALLCRVGSWKVDGIVSFSKLLLKIIEESNKKHKDAHASADDFIPLLIYTIARANPSLVHTNIEFINTFCNPKKLSGGECAYYYTSFCAAVSFLDNIKAEHLNVDNDYFTQLRFRSIPEWYRTYQENLFSARQAINYKNELEKRVKALQMIFKSMK